MFCCTVRELRWGLGFGGMDGHARKTDPDVRHENDY